MEERKGQNQKSWKIGFSAYCVYNFDAVAPMLGVISRYFLGDLEDKRPQFWFLCGIAEPNFSKRDKGDFRNTALNLFLQKAIQKFDLHLVSTENLDPFGDLETARAFGNTEKKESSEKSSEKEIGGGLRRKDSETQTAQSQTKIFQFSQEHFSFSKDFDFVSFVLAEMHGALGVSSLTSGVWILTPKGQGVPIFFFFFDFFRFKV